MSSPLRRAISINYHFLRTPTPGPFGLRAHETPERFDAQLAQISKRFPFARAGELVDLAREAPESSVVLTFDDGARDVAEWALPLLEKHGATASVFVCAQPYLENRLLEIQKIEFLMKKRGIEGFRDAFYASYERLFGAEIEREPLEFAGGYDFYRYDDEAMRRFKLDLNYQIPYAQVVPILDALFSETFGEGSEAEAVRETYLSVDDLKRLLDLGLELGVHTHRHRVLPRLDFDQQKQEIEIGANFLRDLTGQTDFTVAYPYGFCDENTHRAMRELGLRAGLTMERRIIELRDLRERWSIPRYDVNDCFDRESNQLVNAVFAQLATVETDHHNQDSGE
ncbi:MAG: polysaccharide deacetylase family protein [Deltaproteobacteria bacterium]|nr:polysaccharide deacetylase family protein [Deltaproteobacteria bacterium]MBW2543457.1 polysaccharide deacetylase family protein [Deltaproteobacteria bacterium]